MKSFPWNSIIDGIDEESGFPIYDRPYDAEDFRDVMQRFFTDGIFSDKPLGFGVTAGTGMTLNVDGGACMISGTNGIEDESRVLMVQAADKELPRIDTVVLRWNSDIDERNIDLYIHEGKPAKEPVRPDLTRLKGSVWELGICDILIPAGSTLIPNYNITDTRLDPTRCGIVTPFAEFDSTSLYNAIRARVAEMYAKLQDQTDIAVELAKNALDDTLAGHLQNQIDDINDYTTGINLLRGTQEFIRGSNEEISGIYKDGFSYSPSGSVTLTHEIDTGGYGNSVAVNSTNTLKSVEESSYVDVDEIHSGAYTVSLEVMFDHADGYTSDSPIASVFYYDDEIMNTVKAGDSITLRKAGIDPSMIKTGSWYKASAAFSLPIVNGLKYLVVELRINGKSSIRFRKVKLEDGSINNPIWSPSPFDIAQNNGVVHKAGDTMTGELILEKPLSIKSGGTGGNTSSGARKNLGILSGVTEVTLRAGQGQNVSVMFTEKLSKPPVVVIMPLVNDTETAICELISTSTTGFTMNCSAGTSGQAFILPFKFNWIAIETV